MKKGMIASYFIGLVIMLQIMQIPLAFAQERGTSLTGLIPCTANRGGIDTAEGPSGLNCNTWDEFVEVIQFLINYAFVIATTLATISFAYAGWLYLTSNGDMGKVKQAHGIFIKVIQGFLVLGLAYLLVKTILTKLSFPDYNKLQ